MDKIYVDKMIQKYENLKITDDGMSNHENLINPSIISRSKIELQHDFQEATKIAIHLDSEYKRLKDVLRNLKKDRCILCFEDLEQCSGCKGYNEIIDQAIGDK